MDCIFCKIINKELPSYIVYEDDNFMAILDKFPASKGHIVILTKEHVEDFYTLPDEIAQKLLPVTKKIALALKNTCQIEGLNVLQNNGSAAGQTVFHYHIHLVPRYIDDSVTFGWDHQEPSGKDFEKLHTQIVTALT